MSGKKVFLLGPGFVGGEVLDHLLEEKYEVTTLVRSQRTADAIQGLGVKIVRGTMSDKDIIARQASVSDIVIHTASADDLPSVEAVLEGITQRVQSGGTPPIYIHTSGAGVVGDDAAGNFLSDKIYEDDKPEAIDALPDEAPHRIMDLAILKAAKKLGPKAKLAIILPPLIYGISSREKRLSIQLPTMARFAIKHGFAGQIGKGISRWSQIHVKDLARAYMILLHALENNKVQTVDNPYFFCEKGEDLSWIETYRKIGKALYEAGKIPSPEPKTVPVELYGDLFGEFTPFALASNSQSRANRLRALGWKAVEKDALASFDDELAIISKETGEFNGYTLGLALQ